MSHPRGARWLQMSSNCANDGMDFAAMVRIGPAATKLQRILRGPSSRARYRLVDSSADLATPIQLYAGHATVLSKSNPTMLPPSVMRGMNASARVFNENAET